MLQDRLGGLQAFLKGANVVSAPIDLQGKPVQITVNVSGAATVAILTEDFKPVPGFSADDCVMLEDGDGLAEVDGLCQRVQWAGKSWLGPEDVAAASGSPLPSKIRLQVHYGASGVELFAVYLAHKTESISEPRPTETWAVRVKATLRRADAREEMRRFEAVLLESHHRTLVAQLAARVAQQCGLATAPRLQYVDDEGDAIELTTDAELVEAMRLAKDLAAAPMPLLRLRVTV